MADKVGLGEAPADAGGAREAAPGAAAVAAGPKTAAAPEAAAATTAKKKHRGRRGGRKRHGGEAKAAEASPEAESVAAAVRFVGGADTLVVDAGPMIRQTAVWTMSEDLVSTQGVLDELRDEATREWLSRAPSKVVPRAPSAAAIRAASEAARRTGDLHALSAVDVGIVALAWQLHAEASGLPVAGGEAPSASGRSKSGEAGAAQLRADAAAARAQGPAAAAMWSRPAPWLASAAARKEAAGTSAAEPSSSAVADAVRAAAAAESSARAASTGGAGDLGGRFDDADEDEEGMDEEWLAALDPSTRRARLAEAGTPVYAAAGPATGAAAASAAGAVSPATATPFPSLGGLAAAGLLKPDESESAPSTWRGPARPLAAVKPTTMVTRGAADSLGTSGSATDAPKDGRGAAAAGEGAASGGAASAAAAASALSSLPEEADAEAEAGAAAGGVDEEDDEGDWATPELVAAAQARGADPASMGFAGAFSGIELGASKKDEPRAKVACVTTDFACQNVLMELGVPVVGLDGRKVKKLRRWVLKCDACFLVTPDMGRLFCPQCGSNTLRRLACTRTSRGRTIYHYSKHKADPSIRGTQYTLPAPRGGRQGDLLLREDQLLTGSWKQRAKKAGKPRTSFLADAAGLSGDWAKPEASKKGFTTPGELLANVRNSPGVVVGLGRHPNASKGRDRRGQKKNKRPGSKPM